MDAVGLAEVVDLLVPASDGMPAASEVAATGKWLDRVLIADPTLRGPVERLAHCRTWGDLERLEATEPGTFALATFAVVSAYYLHPRVRKLMGYPGQGPSPILAGESEHYLDDALLAPVIDRGQAYVATPDA
jgi:hypothetical protein